MGLKPRKDKKILKEIVTSSPNENSKHKDILERTPIAFRGHRKLWLDFDYWCRSNGLSRSDVLEDFLLKSLEKTKDDYR